MSPFHCNRLGEARVMVVMVGGGKRWCCKGEVAGRVGEWLAHEACRWFRPVFIKVERFEIERDKWEWADIIDCSEKSD